MNNESRMDQQKDCRERQGKSRTMEKRGHGLYHGTGRMPRGIRTSCRSFTLIELLVVIAMIGIR